MAKLTRPKFIVFLNADTETGTDEGTEVTDTWADQLRGELEAAKQGIKPGLGLHLTTVWCWCVMVREHGYGKGFGEFRQELAGIDKAGEDDPAADPTPPATEH
jgi:hypothetical protein